MDDIDLTDLDRFAGGFPHHVFDVLWREAPVWFHPPTPHTPGGEGFWVLSLTNEHRTAIDGVAFNPNGQLFATAGNDGAVSLWQIGK